MRKWGFGALLGIGWVTALWACVHDLGPTSRAETKSIEATLRPDAILDASRVPGDPNAFWAGPWASGAWFSPQRSGEGVVLEYLEDGRALAIWFTYPPVGAAGSQAWLLASEGHVDGAVLRFDAVLRPTGARFGDAFDPAQVSYEAWGTLEIEFADCDQATLRWQGPEGWGSGSYPVQRLSRLKEIDCGGQRALGAAGARSLAGLDSRSGAWYQPQRSGEGWLLEELDDVIFAAITGDACALASAKTLWPKVVAEIGFDQVEESREQYLRYAIDVTRRLETQETRTPERAISALEVISLLTRN